MGMKTRGGKDVIFGLEVYFIEWLSARIGSTYHAGLQYDDGHRLPATVFFVKQVSLYITSVTEPQEIFVYFLSFTLRTDFTSMVFG